MTPISKTNTVTDNTDKATNVAPYADNGVGKTPTFKTTRAVFALNKKKQLKNLKKDAQISTFHAIANNFNENVNIKCSSGFFLQVASPGFHDLASQSSDNSDQLAINDMLIHCSESRVSLDKLDLLLNRLYTFNIATTNNPLVTVASVTVHVYVTSKLVQLQGSKLVHGVKAPLWFYDNVIKATLERESERMKQQIDTTNSRILRATTSSNACEACSKRITGTDKSYRCPSCLHFMHKKCTSDRSNRSRSQPLNWKCDSCLSIQDKSEEIYILCDFFR